MICGQAVNTNDESVDICKMIDWLWELHEKFGEHRHILINLKDGRSIVFYLPDDDLANIFNKDYQ